VNCPTGSRKVDLGRWFSAPLSGFDSDNAQTPDWRMLGLWNRNKFEVLAENMIVTDPLIDGSKFSKNVGIPEKIWQLGLMPPIPISSTTRFQTIPLNFQ
jgi:hypothetical protein